MAKKTTTEIRTYLDDFIQQADHGPKFFSNAAKLNTVVTAGPRMLEDWRTWSTTTIGLFGLAVAAKYELEMLKLALYDIHIVIDDSSSSKHERDTINTMKSISSLSIDFQRMFDTGGIQIHYLNSVDPPGRCNTMTTFDTQWSTLRFGGSSQLGGVTRKIWSSIISNPATFLKPCNIYIFTDGDPTNEPDDALINSLRDCQAELQRRGYTASAIAFTIIQVGTGVPERKFLQSVLDDATLRNHVEVVMEEDSLESTFPDNRNPSQDKDFVLLRQFFGALSPKTLP